MIDANKYFMDNGIYQLKADISSLYICKGINEKYIGKLDEYKKVSNKGSIYEKTGNSYFLNGTNAQDIRSYITNRDNHEMIGRLGNNYYLSCNDEYLVKG